MKDESKSSAFSVMNFFAFFALCPSDEKNLPRDDASVSSSSVFLVVATSQPWLWSKVTLSASATKFRWFKHVAHLLRQEKIEAIKIILQGVSDCDLYINKLLKYPIFHFISV